MKYPKVYLVLDSCFAIKRWIRPREWMKIARDMGFRYVQASTDNEIDPLFSTDDYMSDWFDEVKTVQKKEDMQLVNFYTGYQTYRTVGLAHHDERIRRKITDEWIKKLILKIAGLGAKGLGFSFFAIPHAVLQDPGKYEKTMEMICAQMADIAQFAYENGRVQVSFEQMYAPHQPPFTIKGTEDMLRRIYDIYKKPSYVTIDVGHMVGQRKFLMPKRGQIVRAVKEKQNIWLGSDRAQRLFEDGMRNESGIEEIADRIEEDVHAHEYLFAERLDSDMYNWLEALGCYSPIIHLQQTDGKTSGHAAFTPETNKEGIVRGDKMLESIKKSYEVNREKPLQDMTEDIYLSFEIFGANTETGREIIAKLQQSIDYFRQWVPEDGMRLDELV